MSKQHTIHSNVRVCRQILHKVFSHLINVITTRDEESLILVLHEPTSTVCLLQEIFPNITLCVANWLVSLSTSMSKIFLSCLRTDVVIVSKGNRLWTIQYKIFIVGFDNSLQVGWCLTPVEFFLISRLSHVKIIFCITRLTTGNYKCGKSIVKKIIFVWFLVFVVFW